MFQPWSIIPTSPKIESYINQSGVYWRNREMLPRYKPMRKKRPKPRRGEPSSEEKTAIRNRAFDDAGHKCEFRAHELCSGDRELPKEGSVFDRGHLMHPRNRRVYGWRQENVSWGPPFEWQAPGPKIGCYWCHIVVQHSWGKDGKKPCPPKPRNTI